MGKKLISALLLLAFLLTLTAPGYAVIAAPGFKITVPDGKVAVNDVFSVTVSFNSVTEKVYGADVVIKYDPVLVQNVVYENGSSLGAQFTLLKHDPVNGEIAYAAADQKTHTGTLELVRLKFKAVKNGSARFSFKSATAVTLVNGRLLENSGYTGTGGAVTIAAAVIGGGGGGNGGDGGGKKGGGTISLPGAAGPGTMPFTDVPADHWAVNDIVYLYNNNIISGFSDGTFRPQKTTTRAELAVIVTKALKLDPAATDKGGSFLDVSGQHWAFKEIETVAKAGLMVGFDGRFRPGDEVTREEMIQVIIKALHYGRKAPLPAVSLAKLEQFKDKDRIPEWAREAAAEAVGLGLVQGVKPDVFGAGTLGNRAQLAVIVNKMLKLMEAE